MTGEAAPSVGPGRSPESRQFWLVAGVMTAVLVVLIGLFVAFYPDKADDSMTREEQVDAARTGAPDIIVTPESGRAPESPGDPGGWAQLLLLALILTGLATVGGLAWRSTRRRHAPTTTSQEDPDA